MHTRAAVGPEHPSASRLSDRNYALLMHICVFAPEKDYVCRALTAEGGRIRKYANALHSVRLHPTTYLAQIPRCINIEP